jgi:hypothetical protein
VNLAEYRTDFGSLKEHFRGSWYHGNEELEMAVREWLWMQNHDFFHYEILNLCQDRMNAFLCLGII